MSLEYQEADKNFVDYKLGVHPGFPLPMRNGAVQLPTGRNVAFIGAAQTFGRFVKIPFPNLLEQSLGFHALNLGFAGVGPQFFLGHKHLLDLANSADAAVIQLMSGRSIENEAISYIEGFWKGSSTMTLKATGERMYAEAAWEYILDKYEPGTIRELIDETRLNYVSEYIQLLALIKKPKILLWFSTSSPDRILASSVDSGFDSIAGSYPHFITKNEINEILNYVDDYVEVASSRGLPQHLFHAITNEPTNRTPGDFRSSSVYNEYYPSPEMHMLCAYTLSPSLRKALH